MTITREDAAAALDDISAANIHMRRLRHYRETAPILIMWGVIWLVALPFGDLGVVWFTATAPLFIAGIIGSNIIGKRSRLKAAAQLTPEERAAQPNMNLAMAAVGLTTVAIAIAFWPLTPRDLNALIALICAGVYGGMGAWLGWRFSLVGALLGVGTLVGFLFVHHFYFTWMAVVCGGIFIGSGLLLRKA
jgi:hypothetical protein